MKEIQEKHRNNDFKGLLCDKCDQTVKDDSVLSKFKEIRIQNNKYVAKFRNKDIAIDFFIENFTSARVISPDIVKVDVIKRVESIRELLKI